jgi:hypothetical protein
MRTIIIGLKPYLRVVFQVARLGRGPVRKALGLFVVWYRDNGLITSAGSGDRCVHDTVE